MSESQPVENPDGKGQYKGRWRLAMAIAVLVGVVAIVIAVVLNRGKREAEVDARIARDVEAVVEAYLRDLPRLVQTGKYYGPDGTRHLEPRKASQEVHEAQRERERLTFLDRFGAFERLSGQGFERPDYTWQLITRLEMIRTAHMAKGTTKLRIFVQTSEPTAQVHNMSSAGTDWWYIWVSHPDFK